MAALYTGKYIDSDKLRTRLNPTTFVAIFDDDNADTGDYDLVNVEALQDVIDSAEGEVDSYLITTRGLPLAATVNPARDRLLVQACLDFAQALSYERHPEYVRTYGSKDSKDSSIWDRAVTRMLRIKAGMQELPDQDAQNGKPRVIGGTTYDEGPRTITTSADGTDNGGDL